MKKLYVSKYVSCGGNEKTDALKILFDAIKKMQPRVEFHPARDPFPDDPRIKAIVFSGMPDDGRETKIFAYIGFPEDASAQKPVPGMVLAHGGAGHAYAEWVQYWVDHGYAAISFDGFGQVYTGADHTYEACLDFWTYNPESQPPMDCFVSRDQPFEKQGYTYYVADIILSNNILRADARVIADQIGLTGISWGGIASGTVIGYDDRFAFAAPVYGCGFQDICQSKWGVGFRGDGVSNVWDAKLLLGEVRMPVHWFNSDGDPFFDANSVTASAAASENGMLTLIPGFTHGQIEGSAIPELLRFADEQTGKGIRNIKIDVLNAQGDCVQLSFRTPADVSQTDAYVYYKTEDLIYDDKHLREAWQCIRGNVLDNTAVLHIPEDAFVFYFCLRGKVNGGEDEYIHATSGVYTREYWFSEN